MAGHAAAVLVVGAKVQEPQLARGDGQSGWMLGRHFVSNQATPVRGQPKGVLLGTLQATRRQCASRLRRRFANSLLLHPWYRYVCALNVCALSVVAAPAVAAVATRAITAPVVMALAIMAPAIMAPVVVAPAVAAPAFTTRIAAVAARAVVALCIPFSSHCCFFLQATWQTPLRTT
jgi:hypothetical protein